MVNSSDLAFAFDHALPEKKRPQFTEGYEGFNHLVSLVSGVDEAKMHYIIRNHDRAKLEEQKKEFRKARETVLSAYPGVTIDLTIGDDYRNMKEIIDTCPECVEKVRLAYEKLGITPKWKPIRGGTDGAGFSSKGSQRPTSRPVPSTTMAGSSTSPSRNSTSSKPSSSRCSERKENPRRFGGGSCFLLAGVTGIEPVHADFRDPCLTAWLHPKAGLIVHVSDIGSTTSLRKVRSVLVNSRV